MRLHQTIFFSKNEMYLLNVMIYILISKKISGQVISILLHKLQQNLYTRSIIPPQQTRIVKLYFSM